MNNISETTVLIWALFFGILGPYFVFKGYIKSREKKISVSYFGYIFYGMWCTKYKWGIVVSVIIFVYLTFISG